MIELSRLMENKYVKRVSRAITSAAILAEVTNPFATARAQEESTPEREYTTGVVREVNARREAMGMAPFGVSKYGRQIEDALIRYMNDAFTEGKGIDTLDSYLNEVGDYGEVKGQVSGTPLDGGPDYWSDPSTPAERWREPKTAELLYNPALDANVITCARNNDQEFPFVMCVVIKAPSAIYGLSPLVIPLSRVTHLPKAA